MPTLEAIRQELNDCFSKTDTTATTSYACTSSLTKFPQPGLNVEAIGSVDLPLKNTTKLRSACHRSAFGKGEATVVDECVRKTREIDADQLSFSNPEWQPWVDDTIVPAVLRQLGIEAASARHTRAELYKLLLYEKRAMFKPHQDSEKAPGMFGTLAICLPTTHKGGELVLRHGSDTTTWDSSKNSKKSLSYGAWYSDVYHEILPVKSGHRLVLIYNLIDSSGTNEAMRPTIDAGADLKLERALQSWNDGEAAEFGLEGAFLCWALDHQYTEASLNLAGLKGRDKGLVDMTARTAQRTDHSVYLATLERKVYGVCEDYYTDDEEMGHVPDEGIIEVLEDKWHLREVVDMSGLAVTHKVGITRKHMIQEDAFETKMTPCGDDFTGYTGNEGVTNTLWYRVSVMVIVPGYDESLFCIRPALTEKISPESLVKTLMTRCQKSPSDQRPRRTLELALTRLIGRAAREPLQSQWMSGFDFGNWEADITETEREDQESDTDYDVEWHFFCCGPRFQPPVIKYHRQRTPSDKLVAMSLGAVYLGRHDIFYDFMSKVTKPPKKNLIYQLACQFAPGTFSEYAASLTTLFLTYKNFSSLLEALGMIEEGLGDVEAVELDDTNFNTYYEWSEELLRRMLNEVAEPAAEHGRQLAVLLRHREPAIFDEVVLPWLQSQSDMKIMWEFLSTCIEDWSSYETISSSPTWLVDCMRHFLPHLDLARIYRVKPTPYSQTTPNRPVTHHRIGCKRRLLASTFACQMADAIDKLWELEAQQLAGDFLTKMAHEIIVCGIDRPDFYNTVNLPFLRKLGDRLLRRQEQRTPSLRSQFTWILKAFVAYAVGPPFPRSDTCMIKVGSTCDCEHCARVSEFMAHPTESSYSVSANQQIRKHIQEKLGDRDCTYSIDRTGSPHSLVITKHHLGRAWHVAGWKSRLHEAREEIKRFNQDLLKKMTGAEWTWLSDTERLDEHVTVQWVEAVKAACERPDRGLGPDEGERAQRPLQAVSGNTRKRKARAMETCEAQGSEER